MGSTFQARIDGHLVIPGTHTAAGGTTNFYFGPSQTNCTLEPHRQTIAWLTLLSAEARARSLVNGAICARP